MGEELQNQPPAAPGGERRPYIPPDYSTPRPGARKRPRSFARSLLEFIGIIAGAIVVAYFLQAFIVKPFQIPSESMYPTLMPGDRVLVNRLAYRSGQPRRGDIIVFKSPNDPEVDFIKRVVAIGGDTIEIKRGTVLLNGEPLVETYIKSPDISTFNMQTVPQGTVFVLGDNRGDSQDSRFWQSPWLPVEDVIGKAFLTYWPPGRIGPTG